MKICYLKALAMAASIAALTGAAKAADGLAFSPLSLDIPALKGLSEGVKGVGSEKGYDVIVLDPKFQAPAQAEQLTQLITTGRIKAFWAIAVNQGAMKPVLEAAKEAKVVAVVNGQPKDYGYDGMQAGINFAQIDYGAFGGGIGDQTAKCVNDVLGGKAKVIFIQSAEGTAGKGDIESNMEKQLKAGAPGAEVVATLVIKERAEALNKVAQVLQANPDANAVMTPHDEGGLGALSAFEAAGKTAPCIIDGGGNDEVLKKVDEGKIYSSVALNFKADLMQTFNSIEKMMKDPAATGFQTSVPLDIHTKK